MEYGIKWKPVEVLFPKSVKRSCYKAWSTEQMELMINKAADTPKLGIILVLQRKKKSENLVKD